ncbi:MAG: S-layer homology domain-containing protein [Clostridia bacterium]|nr:S-layer homology domain-containing protein [Clostridia bacterium]
MKKAFKKTTSLLLTLIMIISMLSLISFNSSAYTAHSQSESVAWARQWVKSPYDVDGAYGVQCVDLIMAYYAYLGVKNPGGNAVDYAHNQLPSGWSRITYTKGLIPQPGDIVVWSYFTSNLGHIAIVTSASSSGISVAETNGSTHTGREHTYNYTDGTLACFIRPGPDFAGATTAPTSANIAFDKTRYSLNDKMYVSFSSDTYVEKYKIQIWYGSELIYDYETSESSLELSCAHFGAGTFSAYVTAVNPLGYHTSSTVDFTIVSKPSNPQIAINNSIFSLSDMITVTASANGGIDYYGIQVWKGSTVVYQKEFIGHSINIPCSELGTGDFATFVSCVNISGAINTDTVYFTITNSSACSHSYTNKVTKQATCTADGVRTYTCSTCGYSYTETINKLGHSWGTPTYKWSSDNKTCTATRTCTNDSSHKDTETVNTTSQVIKQPTTTATGTRKFTATFTNSAFTTQTKNVSIPKLNEPVDDDIYFPDVSENSWYYDAVQYVAKAGFMSGYQNGYFGPGDSLKRQDFVVILANIADVNLSSYASMTPRLKDVKKGAYYAAAVNWAVDNNIIAGYANGNFGVNDPITREQVATILYRYMDEPSVSGANSILSRFSDSGRISTFAKTPVAWAVKNEIISGMADGRVAPTEGASRAQIASIIMRMDQKGMF